MAEYVPLEIPDNPKLPKILFILGVLYGGGIAIGPGRVIDAIDAVRRQDLPISRIFIGRCMPVL